MSEKLNFIHNNTVYIHGLFDDSLSTILPEIANIIKCQKESRNGEIIFHINSSGGSACWLLNLLEYIEKAKQDNIIVKTIVLAKAYSCGSMLACSGSVGHRYIGEYAEHLVHLGSVNLQTITTEEQMLRLKEYTTQHFELCKKIYTKYASIPNLNQKLKDGDYYIYGKDIIEYGLADKFFSEIDNYY